MAGLRVSVKAVIVRDGRLLVTANRDSDGTFYLLPGGGQHFGEPLPTALRRECSEEVGVDVDVQELVLVRDYISANHEFASEEPNVHQVELFFRCTIDDDAVPINGSAPDTWQTGVDWLELARLDEYRLYPKTLCQLLPTLEPSPSIYVGDVN